MKEMARSSRASSRRSWPRILHPLYYLRRPRRLFILLGFFLATTFLLWNQHQLPVLQQQQQQKLTSELIEQDLQRLSEEASVDEVSSILIYKVTKDMEFAGDAKKLGNESDSEHDPVTVWRRQQVKAAMLHAWSSYEKYAWGFDELQPQSKQGINEFGGFGATIVDSLDTLYIMGLQKQFQRARDWVAEHLVFNKNYEASVFETTIRLLGGLLSSYDLTGDMMFLHKAEQLAEQLMPAWDSPSGIPYNKINMQSQHTSNSDWAGASSTLADLGTEQLEFIGLSQRTGNPKFKQRVEKVIMQLRKVFPSDGLLPIYINPNSGKPTAGKITFGAMGDSFYEYLLKVWIQGNKTEVVKHYREMWEQSMEGMMGLIMKSSPSGYTFIAERTSRDAIRKKMDELACFAPGMLTLGTEGASPEKASKYLELAKELAWTCYNFYMSTPTKLAGEEYYFTDGNDMSLRTKYNLLRPETVESLMYLWRKTGDPKYRDWGWNIFQAFELQSRTPFGYVGLKDVTTGRQDNRMQSYFLAETLKYLYLLFSPSSVIPLDEWVFNTEAHPLRIIPRVHEPVSLEEEIPEEVIDTDAQTDSILISDAEAAKRGRSGG
ncbi:unnamed protein product [Sphagnum jensenii]|uniref:alpha-1,2-Mannosidase n=1 Tax=Sphagnum jensenii TaxID=128206 RepID=A0ABP1ALQ4_9BRYO